MISSNFNWGQDRADLLRRAARCAPLWGASGKTAFYERGLFTRLLDRQITRLGPLEDLVNVTGGSAHQVLIAQAVRHQSPFLSELLYRIDDW